jgi:4-amino-4-deoxy-L-arabinose transferase-like glycosyltransferase
MAERTPWLQTTESRPWSELAVRPSICWWIIGAAVVTVAVFGFIAASMTPPAVSIADDDFTFAAILGAAGVIVWIAGVGRTYGRAAQLGAFVSLLVIAGTWSSARQWNHERQFDYLASRQRQQLRLSAIELSGNLLNFLRERRQFLPPPPSPRTWDKDERAIIRFEADTVKLFEQRYGRDVRSTHDLLALRGFRDRDFDMVYRRPADEFHIRTIAIKLAALSNKIDR